MFFVFDFLSVNLRELIFYNDENAVVCDYFMKDQFQLVPRNSHQRCSLKIGVLKNLA